MPAIPAFNAATPLLPKSKKAPSPPSTLATLRFCLPFVIPTRASHYLQIVACITSILFAKAFHLINGLFIKLSVDSLTSTSATPSTTPLTNALIFVAGRLLVAIFTQAFESLQEYYSQRVQKEFSSFIFASHVSHHLLQHDESQTTGEVITIMKRAITSLDTLLKKVVFWFVPTVIETLYVTAIFFSLHSPLIAVSTLLTVTGHAVYTSKITGTRKRLARCVRDTENSLWSYANERVANVETVRMFGTENAEIERHIEHRERLRANAFKEKSVSTLFAVSSDFLLQIGTGVCFYIAGREAYNGNISVGDFSMAVTYVSALFWPMLVLSQDYGQVITAIADIEQVVMLVKNCSPPCYEPSTIVHSLESVGQYSGSRPSPTSIEFKNVSFSYDSRGDCKNDTAKSNPKGVQNISFRSTPGNPIALVGPSGSGKTSCLSLLLGLYKPSRGEIILSPFTSKISPVPQSTTIFAGTLRENLQYGSNHLHSDSELLQSIQKAGLADFVNTLPFGLDTVLGESGLNLSGGERQRVGIARMFTNILDEAVDFIVLDEVTASLSPVDEETVHTSVRQVCEQKAAVLVAHKLKSVKFVKEILVIQNGIIIERGPHEALMTITNGLYKKMWETQQSM